MEADFQRIKQAFQDIHKEFLTKNPFLIKYCDHGVWAPSIPKELFRIFKRYEDKSRNFLDLGSGDGIAVFVASLFFKHASGIELTEEFFDLSVKMKEKLDINNVMLMNDDFLNVDFTPYDIIFIAPDKQFSLRLENKLERELNGILIVYSSIFQPKLLPKIDEFETKHFTVCVYKNIPKKV